MLKKPSKAVDKSGLEDDRKISWADLTDDESKAHTSALRLTYSKWKRKFKGEKSSSPPPSAEVTMSPEVGNEIDVTTLIRRSKKTGKENNQPPVPPTRWVIENADPSLSAPPRPIGSDVEGTMEELAPEDLNLLVTTLTALSKSLGGFHTEETANETSKCESGEAATPTEPYQQPQDWAPPLVDYQWQQQQMWQPSWLTQPTIEDVTVVGGLSLRTWRSHLIALAYADPQTLAARLQTGLARDLLQGLDLPRSRSLSTPVACPPPPPPLFQIQSAPKPKQQRRPPPSSQQPPERPPPSEGRFKQIARCKSTPEYLLYVEKVPRDQRKPEDPATPRVAGSSWREFSAEVRQWKIQLHRKAEALQASS